MKKAFAAVAFSASTAVMAAGNAPFYTFEIPAALNSSGKPLNVSMTLTGDAEIFQSTQELSSTLTPCAKYAEHAIDTAGFIDELVNKATETTPVSQRHDALYISELKLRLDQTAGLKKGVELCQHTSSPGPAHDYALAKKVLSGQSERLTQMLKTARSVPKP